MSCCLILPLSETIMLWQPIKHSTAPHTRYQSYLTQPNTLKSSFATVRDDKSKIVLPTYLSINSLPNVTILTLDISHSIYTLTLSRTLGAGLRVLSVFQNFDIQPLPRVYFACIPARISIIWLWRLRGLEIAHILKRTCFSTPQDTSIETLLWGPSVWSTRTLGKG